EPTPQPQPEPTPQPQPEPAPEPQPTPVPDKVVRPAVIPQVPAYISLPTAFLSFEENLLSLFKAQARDDSSFFAFCYKGSDRYHTRENFQRYGYNFHSQYHGWMLGTQRTLLDREQQRANLSVGVAWGKLSMVPQARDGVSNSQFDTLSLFSQLTWQHDSGLTLSAPFGYTHFRGKVNTDMRGRVASPTASSWHLGLDAEKTWQLGNHRVGPVAGLLYQHLQINSLRDSDNANVSWQMQRTPLYSLGAAWRYQCERCPTQQASLGGSLRYVHRSSHTNKTRVGDSTNHATFNSGKGGNGIQLAADMALNVADNVKLTGQLQHQRRTEKEGINDWGITGGIKVTF
ncbi:autotransporter outer membrane beta-barrel domain-containing protein, partial [Mixta calida]